MFSAYFEELEKKLIKKYKTTGKTTAQRKSAKTAKATKAVKTVKASTQKANKQQTIDVMEAIDNCISPQLVCLQKNIMDDSGYMIDTTDFCVAENIFKDMSNIYDATIPAEIVRGSFHLCPEINRKNLLDVLVRVAHTKKIDQYSENQEEPGFISSFIIGFNSIYTLAELKKSILEIYSKENVDPKFEFDVMIVLGEGVVIKDWRDRRSYIALETRNDSLKWFFILMNEYLEIEKTKKLDLRSYVKEKKHYTEY
jgi:hypothetical protein